MTRKDQNLPSSSEDSDQISINLRNQVEIGLKQGFNQGLNQIVNQIQENSENHG
jgi:hypothetical protein